MDGSGQPLAPTTTYVPSLRFFLGPADSAQDERDAAYAAILRDVRDPETRKKVEEEMARSRLYLQRHAFGDTTRRACWSVASDLQSSRSLPGTVVPKLWLSFLPLNTSYSR